MIALVSGKPENLKSPAKGDVGYDLVADSSPLLDEGERFVEYRTGVKIKPPKGHFAAVFPRSSISKYSLALCNSVAVIDPSYTGEIILRFNIIPSNYKKWYVKGDKIAQIAFIPFITPNIWETENLDETERGDGGFGSTGE